MAWLGLVHNNCAKRPGQVCRPSHKAAIILTAALLKWSHKPIYLACHGYAKKIHVYLFPTQDTTGQTITAQFLQMMPANSVSRSAKELCSWPARLYIDPLGKKTSQNLPQNRQEAWDLTEMFLSSCLFTCEVTFSTKPTNRQGLTLQNITCYSLGMALRQAIKLAIEVIIQVSLEGKFGQKAQSGKRIGCC